jgi:hypothetical protein
MTPNALKTTALRAPDFLDRMFGFPAMQLREADLPELSELDEADAIERLERIHTETSSRLEDLERALADTKTRAAGAPATSPVPGGGTGQIAPAAANGLVLGKGDAIELAIQTWRLSRRVETIDAERFPRERKQLTDSLRRFQRILESLRIEVIDPTGQVYVPGWVEVEVVSWEPPDPGSDGSVCKVKQTIAPIVRRAGEIIARGQVVATDTAN